MINELQENYCPEDLINRTEEYKDLQDSIETFISTGRCENRIIIGITGSGKTLLIRSLLKNYKCIKYVSADKCKTALRVMQKVADSNYLLFDRNIESLSKEFKSAPKILIIDELNEIKDPRDLFAYLNTFYKEVQTPIFLISNRRNIAENIDDASRNTLFFQKMLLKSYNAMQIQLILQQRIDILKQNNPLALEGINIEALEAGMAYISAKSMLECSARIAINLLRHCIEKRIFSYSFIDKWFNDVRFDDWKDYLKCLSSLEKQVLNSLCEYYSTHSITESVKTSEIFQRLASKEVSPSRFSQVITILEQNYCFITTQDFNQGMAGGKYRLIKFASKELYEIIETYFNMENVVQTKLITEEVH